MTPETIKYAFQANTDMCNGVTCHAGEANPAFDRDMLARFEWRAA